MSIKKLALAAGTAAMMTSSVAYASVIDRPFFKVLGVVVVWGADDFSETSTATTPIASDFVLLTNASGTAGADLIAGDVYSVVTGTLDPISGTDISYDAGGTVDPITGQPSGGVFGDTGSTAGLLDATDTLTAFGVDADTDVDGMLTNTHKSSFFVASNAAFDIHASATNLVTTGDFASTTTVGAVTTDDFGYGNISFDLAVDAAPQTIAGLAIADDAQDPSTGGTGVVSTITTLDDIDGGLTKVFDGGQRTAATRGSIADQSVEFEATYELTDAFGGYDLSWGAGTISADVTYTVYVP